MTFLADTGLWTPIWSVLSWVLPFLFVLGVVVFVHEEGGEDVHVSLAVKKFRHDAYAAANRA